MRRHDGAAAPLPDRVCFVVPTFNEARNIDALLERLAALYPGDGFLFLIVDDRSPDGTAEHVRRFAAHDARVHLLEGERRGLGDAYVRGIGHAMEQLGADAVVQMDADFSHDPADAMRLLERLADADVAIGSRYVDGGAVDERWNLRRRLLSRWGNRLARWVAGVRGVRDCTAGFKAIRCDALRRAGVDGIRARGYVFQVVLLHRLLRSGAKVVEEPIYFKDREQGETKLGFGAMVEFLLNVWWLRLGNHRTFIKFAITGASGVVVNLGSFQLLLELGVGRYLASPIAVELAILSNFLINNGWTFAHRKLSDGLLVRALKYNLVSLLALGVNTGTFVSLDLLFPGNPPVLLQAIGIIPATVLNYVMNAQWTFRHASGEGPNKV